METLLEPEEYHPTRIWEESVLKAASSSNKWIQWTETTVDTQNTICYSFLLFLHEIQQSIFVKWYPIWSNEHNYRETESLLQLFLSKRKLMNLNLSQKSYFHRVNFRANYKIIISLSLHFFFSTNFLDIFI